MWCPPYGEGGRPLAGQGQGRAGGQSGARVCLGEGFMLSQFFTLSNFLSSPIFCRLEVRLQFQFYRFLGVFRVCMRVFVLCFRLSSKCNHWFASSVASGWVGG